MTTLADRLLQARRIHGDRYQYPDLIPENEGKFTFDTKMRIECSIHGTFHQNLRNHLVGKQNCPQCGKDARKISIRKAHDDLKSGKRLKADRRLKASPERLVALKEAFLQRARDKYGSHYTYDHLDYQGVHVEATITCPIHGNFSKTPNRFLQGAGCPKCSVQERVKPLQEFIEQAQRKHNSFYSYDKSVYTTTHAKVTITCPLHGDFEQAPSGHLRGTGCSKCSAERASKNNAQTVEQFVAKAKQLHENLYDYNRVLYKNIKTPVEIVCKKHGPFKQTPDNHTNALSGCPNCATIVSKGHQQVIDFLVYLGFEEQKDFLVNDRKTLRNPNTENYLELDIYLPQKKFAIEYEGLYNHSYGNLETTKQRQKHYHKQSLCAELGITLFQVYDQEWLRNKELVKSMIRNRLGLVTDKLGARKCTVVRNLPRKAYQDFLAKNHIQGAVESSLRYGLVHNSNLVAVLGFSQRGRQHHLDRFCSLINMSIAGAFTKLLKVSLGDIDTDIITFSDRRYATGQLYKSTGFQQLAMLPPDIAYVYKDRVVNRQHLQKQKLPKLLGEAFDSQLTEAENLFNNGYRRLWGSGKIKWIYRYQAAATPEQVDLKQLSDNVTV